MQDTTLEKYREIFGEGSLAFLKEQAADEFALLFTNKNFILKIKIIKLSNKKF